MLLSAGDVMPEMDISVDGVVHTVHVSLIRGTLLEELLGKVQLLLVDTTLEILRKTAEDGVDGAQDGVVHTAHVSLIPGTLLEALLVMAQMLLVDNTPVILQPPERNIRGHFARMALPAI